MVAEECHPATTPSSVQSSLGGAVVPARRLPDRKDPATRITAASAADESLALLATQSTKVLDAGTSPEPTLVGELVSAEWQMPTIDDPTWHAPQATVRRRAVTAALVAGALIGGLVGGVLALRPGDSEGGGSADGSAETPASDRAGLSGGGDQARWRCIRQGRPSRRSSPRASVHREDAGLGCCGIQLPTMNTKSQPSNRTNSSDWSSPPSPRTSTAGYSRSRSPARKSKAGTAAVRTTGGEARRVRTGRCGVRLKGRACPCRNPHPSCWEPVCGEHRTLRAVARIGALARPSMAAAT